MPEYLLEGNATTASLGSGARKVRYLSKVVGDLAN